MDENLIGESLIPRHKISMDLGSSPVAARNAATLSKGARRAIRGTSHCSANVHVHAKEAPVFMATPSVGGQTRLSVTQSKQSRRNRQSEEVKEPRNKIVFGGGNVLSASMFPKHLPVKVAIAIAKLAKRIQRNGKEAEKSRGATRL